MPAYAEIERACVVAVAGTTQEKASAFAKKWNVGKAYYGADGVTKLCGDAGVDVIDVGIPNNLHLQTIVTASENHKHIICEKPLARNAAEAKKALDVAEKHGVLNCYAENQVFMPQLTRAMEFVGNGVIGKILGSGREKLTLVRIVSGSGNPTLQEEEYYWTWAVTLLK
jgi:predicted dehydrogenase